MVGITFFILGEIKPIYHVVWHLFVVVAAALHWFCVYFFIVSVDLTLSEGGAFTKARVLDVVDTMQAAATMVHNMGHNYTQHAN